MRAAEKAKGFMMVPIHSLMSHCNASDIVYGSHACAYSPAGATQSFTASGGDSYSSLSAAVVMTAEKSLVPYKEMYIFPTSERRCSPFIATSDCFCGGLQFVVDQTTVQKAFRTQVSAQCLNLLISNRLISVFDLRF